MKIIISIILFILFAINTTAQSYFIPANHEDIRIVGRVEYLNNSEVHFDWSGVYIQFSFRGSECSVVMNDSGHNYYNVFIDNELPKVFEVKSDTTILIAKNLGTNIHTVQIFKRTEGNQGKAIFKGILLAESGELLEWKKIPKRKIEFIGNSITCGYGVEGKSRTERWHPSTENNYQSYAAIIARALNADYHIVAHSGLGVVRNYGDKNKVSASAMSQRFNRVYDEKESPLWNFKKWTPDLVVINLGTNDFSTIPYPDENIFKSAYEKLISEIRKQYGEIPVFCIVGPMMDEPCYKYVKSMVDELRIVYKRNNVYFIGVPTYLLDSEKDFGSDAHPNYPGNKKMAAHISPVISTVMKWELNNNEMK